jgi:NADPH:quinone reductase-like Zn-dependent oxidoreductase
MKAIILRELGSPEKFEEVDLPLRPPKSDEVLVQIKAGSINPIDCKMREGWIEAPLPIVLGRDCAGLVAAIGHDVRRFREGDEVWVYLGGPCSNGAYAEYTTVPHHFVSLKPHNLTYSKLRQFRWWVSRHSWLSNIRQGQPLRIPFSSPAAQAAWAQ